MALQGIDLASSGVVRNIQADPAGGLVISPGVADTAFSSGSANAPASATNIASIAAASLPAGQYTVTVMYFFSGGTNEILTNNLKLTGPTTTVTGLPTLAAQNVLQQVTIPRVTMAGGTQIQVHSVAAATAGTIYNVYLQATRIT